MLPYRVKATLVEAREAHRGVIIDFDFGTWQGLQLSLFALDPIEKLCLDSDKFPKKFWIANVAIKTVIRNVIFYASLIYYSKIILIVLNKLQRILFRKHRSIIYG